MSSRARATAFVVALLLVTTRAVAEPAFFSDTRLCTTGCRLKGAEALPVAGPPAPGGYVHLKAPTLLVRNGVTLREVQPGYYLDDGTYARLDLELHRLQDTETRLTAENDSLRDGVDGWQPGWKTLLLTFLVGMAGGAYAYHRL